jgi:O-antigen/teichoic acid export membrane protein
LEPVRESKQEPPAPAAPPASPHLLDKPGLGFRVFQNVTAIFAGRVISIPLSIATSILLVRFLGREQMGEYGALYAYLSFFGFLSTSALAQILAREASVRRAEAVQIFHVATMVGFAFSLFGAALAYLLGPRFGFHGTMHWLILVAALDTLILPPFQVPGIIFQVDMRQWFAVGLGLMRQALWLAAVVLLALHNAAFYEVVIARTLCGAAQCAGLLMLIRKQGSLTGPRHFEWDEARKLVRDAFPLALTFLAVSIYHRIDQVMLHNMSGDKVLGPYVVAVQMTEFFSLLPNALMSSLFPALSQSVSDPPRFDRYLRESYRFLLVVVFAACAVVTPIAAPFVELFYGKEFLPTAPLLIVLIWSEAPIFFAAVLGNAMIAKGLQRYMPFSAFAGAFANVLLNLWLIPKYGALGSSWATVVSYTVSSVLFLLVFSELRVMIVRGLRIALIPLLLALGVTFVSGALPFVFWWKLLFSCAAYIACAFLLGLIGRSDLDRLKGILRVGLRNA